MVVLAAEDEHHSEAGSEVLIPAGPDAPVTHLDPVPDTAFTTDERVATKERVHEVMVDALLARCAHDGHLRYWANSHTVRTAPESISDGVERVIDSWAQDSHARVVSVALQQAVQRRFGTADMPAWEPLIGEWDDEDLDRRVDPFGPMRTLDDSNVGWVETADPFLDAYVEEQYAITQGWLADHGVDRLVVHRGMFWEVDPGDVHEAPYPGARHAVEKIRQHDGSTWVDGDDVPATGSPLTAWSTSSLIAERFATRHLPRGGQRLSLVMSAQVPADRVFSTPHTGLGCLNEREVVVIGGPGTARSQWSMTGVIRLRVA